MDDLDRKILTSIAWHVLEGTSLDDPDALLRLEFADAAIARANTEEDSMPTNTKVYRDLEAGDSFHSPRPEEGVVTVICPPGKCIHDRSRDEYGCHVWGAGGVSNQFFVNHIPSEEVRMYELPGWLT